MAALDPIDAGASKRFSQSGLDLERLPPLYGIQMVDKIWQQPHSEALDRTARLVSSLMLIEAPVGVARSLTYV